jgi:NAD(P)-dependent dehydrogenase (short-subunit alcohol dehydrogenase family)
VASIDRRSSNHRFEDAVVLITGGAGGIGAAIGKGLADEGAFVGICDASDEAAQHVAATIRDQGGRAAGYHLDVRLPNEVRRVALDLQEDGGPLTGAVVAAGVFNTTSFLDLDETTWNETFDVNLKGAFLTIQEVSRLLVADRRPGRIVVVASIAAYGARATAVDYAASKAGLLSLVRSAAVALAPHGIAINAVCPGIVDTPMTKQIHEARARLEGGDPAESLRRMIERVPLGRIESPEDVARSVLFLMSDEAAYVTGSALDVDGGIQFA